MLTKSRLSELLNYDPVIGKFTWNKPVSHKVKAGDVAGSKDAYGYLVLCLDGKRYKAHRLAWFFCYDELPTEIDHINGVKDDNSIANLRKCDRAQNMQNKGKYSSNSSGFIGVSKHGNKWSARISLGKVSKYLGAFETPDAAYQAYLEGKQEHHKFQPDLNNRIVTT